MYIYIYVCTCHKYMWQTVTTERRPHCKISFSNKADFNNGPSLDSDS